MDEHRINELADKILKKTITQQELEGFEQWYTHFDSLEFYNSTDSSKAEMAERLFLKISRAGALSGKKNNFSIFSKLAVAATVLITLTGLAYFIFLQSAGESNRPTAGAASLRPIVPGKNIAFLKRQDGTVIALSTFKNAIEVRDNSIQYLNGEKINNSETDLRAPATILTPRGGQYTVLLSDGTLVALNSASSLTFPSSFKGLTNRTVELTGEGYFEVSKNKNHPFTVISKGQRVEVLGTHFNINAYPDEPTVKTTLLEGSVQLLKGGIRYTLLPGQQGESSANKIRISQVDASAAAEWRNGEFVFQDMDFKTAMRSIARWYDVEMVFSPAQYDDIEIGGWISRSKKLEEVLKWISSTNQVHFKIEGRRVLIGK